jgi:Flp pilus assembly protein TadG
MSALRYRTNRGRRFPGRCGAAAVEFAMTVPIMLLLLFGALELGRMNMIRQTANNAAYEAARTCIVPGATKAEGVNAAKAVLDSIGVTYSDPVITLEPPAAEITDTTLSVTATVVVPYGTNMWVRPLFSKTGSATATCTLTRDWAVSTRSSAN